MTAVVPRWPGLAFVIALHGAAFWLLWQHRLIPAPSQIEPMFVHFIAPLAPAEKPRQPAPTKPRAVDKAPARQLVAERPSITPTEYAASPAPEAVPVVAEPPMALPAGPITLGPELALSCPGRPPPHYPTTARRLRETGTVVLRVELDEQGLITATRVETSSGFASLDHAAQTAVKAWQCQPPRRNGEPVRAIARQPFHFVLQGS